MAAASRLKDLVPTPRRRRAGAHARTQDTELLLISSHTLAFSSGAKLMLEDCIFDARGAASLKLLAVLMLNSPVEAGAKIELRNVTVDLRRVPSPLAGSHHADATAFPTAVVVFQGAAFKTSELILSDVWAPTIDMVLASGPKLLLPDDFSPNLCVFRRLPPSSTGDVVRESEAVLLEPTREDLDKFVMPFNTTRPFCRCLPGSVCSPKAGAGSQPSTTALSSLATLAAALGAIFALIMF